MSKLLIFSVLLLGAVTLGSADAAHTASHREAPLIDFDNKADITNVFVDPKLPITPSSGNQVNGVSTTQPHIANTNSSSTALKTENLIQTTIDSPGHARGTYGYGFLRS